MRRDILISSLPRTPVLGAVRFCAFVAAFVVVSPAVMAQELLENTYLIDFSLGSSRSAVARSLSIGGYELADGTAVRFSEWYQPAIPEINVIFLSQINPYFGVTWGLGLGERGEKYSIQPGIWLGFIYRVELARNSSLTFSALTMIGGDMSERPCVADYGQIGGVQAVNCRLAASTLPPADTLQYLISIPGSRETRFSIRYEIRF